MVIFSQSIYYTKSQEQTLWFLEFNDHSFIYYNPLLKSH
jgi:hypothetical protein